MKCCNSRASKTKPQGREAHSGVAKARPRALSSSFRSNWQNDQLKIKQRQPKHEGLKRQGVATARPFQQTLEWYDLGVEELGQGRLTLFGFWIVQLAQGEEKMRVYLWLGSLFLLQWLKISLLGDMRQGPTCVLVTQGFDSANYKYM